MAINIPTGKEAEYLIDLRPTAIVQFYELADQASKEKIVSKFYKLAAASILLRGVHPDQMQTISKTIFKHHGISKLVVEDL